MTVKALTQGDVKFLVVHCSATQAKADIGAKDIDRWHRDRGFLKIGYHFVIRRDGTVETGRGLNERGAHAEGHNHESVGICMAGGIDAKGQPEANFTEAQYASLRSLLVQLTAAYPGADVIGHRDLPHVTKACPSFDVRAWWDDQPASLK